MIGRGLGCLVAVAIGVVFWATIIISVIAGDRAGPWLLALLIVIVLATIAYFDARIT